MAIQFVQAVLAVVLAGNLYAADSPFVGTWKLNPEKSRLTAAAPKSWVMRIEQDGGQMRMTTDIVTASGKEGHRTWTGKLDGQQYPAQGLPSADTVAIKLLDERTRESTGMRDGKVVMRNRATVSKDGKVLTNHISGTNRQGQSFEEVQVFERQ
jgi:hypothetical protein